MAVGLARPLGNLDIRECRRLQESLASARTSVTFWGTRLVTQGDETIALDVVTQFVLRAIGRIPEGDHPGQYSGFQDIARSLIEHYQATDVQVANANYMTQLFVWLREALAGLVIETPFNNLVRIFNQPVRY